MQWDSLNDRSIHHRFGCRISFLGEELAARGVLRVDYTVGYRAQRVSDCDDRLAMHKLRAGNDSFADSPQRWSGVFCGVIDSVVCSALVV